MANRSTILSEIHSSFTEDQIRNVHTEIQGLFPDTGNLAELSYLQNHIGREFYRKLDDLDISDNIFAIELFGPDPTDAGFRPLTFTGLLQIP